jgi:thioredoxin-related protein
MRVSIFVLLFVFLISCANAGENEIKWHSFDEGFAKAQNENKFLLVDFFTDWCGWCKKLDSEVYSNSKIIDYMNKYFVAVKLNPEKPGSVSFNGKNYTPAEFTKSAGVTGYPATGFLTSKGEFVSVVPGYLPADDFYTLLEFFVNGTYTRLNFQDYRLFLQMQKVSANDPTNADVIFFLGYFNYEVMQDYKEAEQYFWKTVDKNPSMGEAYFCLSEIASSRGEKSKGDEYKQKAESFGVINFNNFDNKMVEILRKYMK